MNETQLGLFQQQVNRAQVVLLAEAIAERATGTAIVPGAIVEQNQGHIRIAGELQSRTDVALMASRIPKRAGVYWLLVQLWDVFIEDVAQLLDMSKTSVQQYKDDMRAAGTAPPEPEQFRSLFGDVIRRQTSRVAMEVDIASPEVFEAEEMAILKPLYDVLNSEWELPPKDERSIYRVIRNASIAEKTKQSRISTFNAMARYMKFDALDDYPWMLMNTSAIAEAVHFVETKRPHFRGGARKKSSIAAGWTDHMALFEQLTHDGLMDESEYAKLQRVSKRNNWGSRKGSRVAKAPVIAAGKWLDIVRVIDLRLEKGWELMAMLCTLYPLGMRPADSYMTMKNQVHLDDGYFDAFRSKTDFGGPVMIDVFPAVTAVFEKWLSIIPKGREYLWYGVGSDKVSMDWGRPVTSATEAGSIVGGRVRTHVLRRCGYATGEWMPKSGRASYETACALTPGLTEAVRKMQAGRKGQGSEWEYIDIAVAKMRGQFAKVDEFMEFDAGLAEIIAPALAGEAVSPYELRICEGPDCNEVLSGRQKKYHNKACKQKAYRMRS